MRRHPFDPISMILGAVFTLIGVTFLVGDVNVTNLPPALTWPVPLVMVGLAVIALAVGGSRSGRTHAVAEAPPATAADLGERTTESGGATGWLDHGTEPIEEHGPDDHRDDHAADPH
jgi:hypothetical protein